MFFCYTFFPLFQIFDHLSDTIAGCARAFEYVPEFEHIRACEHIRAFACEGLRVCVRLRMGVCVCACVCVCARLRASANVCTQVHAFACAFFRGRATMPGHRRLGRNKKSNNSITNKDKGNFFFCA